MKVLFIISTEDGETIFNAMRIANVGVKKLKRSVYLCSAKGLFSNRLAVSSSISWVKLISSRAIFMSEGSE